MKHKASLTMSRRHPYTGADFMSITVKDKDAGITCFELEVSLENFTNCLTGLAYQDCSMACQNLENVGKQIERMVLEFKMPPHTHTNTKNVAIVEAGRLTKKMGEGWISSNYFNSQNSFFVKDKIEWAQTSLYRWIEKKENKNGK